MNDQQAISRLKNGDIGGLEYLVSKYQEKALRTAYLITHNRQLSEDVVQETFVRMYQRIRSFDDQRPFEPYLMRSVVNTAINQAEKNLNFVNLDEQITVIDVGNLLEAAGNCEDAVQEVQKKQAILAALKALPPRQRAVIVQRYYLEMSEKEMSEVQSTPPGTIKWLLNSARKRLRTLLGSERSL